MRRRRFTLVGLLILIANLGIISAIVVSHVIDRRTSQRSPTPEAPAARTDDSLARLEAELKPAAGTVWQDGLAAIVLVDVSGSMRDRVRDADGERRRKIQIARRTAVDLVGAFEAYAKEHAGERVLVGVYEFSARRGEPAARAVVRLGPPDSQTARPLIEDMKAEGGTPIGDAMVSARVALDASALRRRHLIVLTDGENTDGRAPADVVRVLERQTDETRAGLYFVAFDIAARVFAPIKESGGLLLSAKDGAELATTFRDLLSDRILVEAPRAAVEK